MKRTYLIKNRVQTRSRPRPDAPMRFRAVVTVRDLDAAPKEHGRRLNRLAGLFCPGFYDLAALAPVHGRAAGEMEDMPCAT